NARATPWCPRRCTGKATRSRSRSAWPAASRSTTSARPRSNAIGRSRSSAPCARTTAPDQRTPPCANARRGVRTSGERVIQHDGVFPVRTGCDQRQAATGQLLDGAQVGAGGGRQLVPVADTGGGFFPAGKFQVDGLALVPAVRIQRRQLAALAPVFVGNADLDGGQAVEHVELGDRQAVDAVDLGGALERDQVDPAAAARTARAGAELVALLAQQLAHLVIEFGRERTAADAGGVGLADAQHVVDVLRTHAGAGQRAADGGVAGGDVRVGAVVDVQQRALRALVQDVAAALAHVVQDGGDVVDQRADVL